MYCFTHLYNDFETFAHQFTLSQQILLPYGDLAMFRLNMMTQFLVGSCLLILCVVFLALSQKQASDIQGQLRDWQSLTVKLGSDVLSLQKQAQHYKLNAPRDFESYNRDVAVFYKQFQQQLTGIESNHKSLVSVSDELFSNSYFTLLADSTPILSAVNQQQSWLGFWQTFRTNLDGQLGNPNEPRLEWGADHIIGTSTNVNERLETLNDSVKAANHWFVKAYETISIITMIAVLFIVVATLMLFALFVIRPIVSTTKVCQKVAAGEYGQTVEVNGTGETKQLQIAFNDLSSRSKLLMDMLNDINKPGDVTNKLQTIYNSGKNALGCSWIGLMSFDEQRANLTASAPLSLDTNFKHRHVSLNKAFGKDLTEALSSHWFELENLRQLSITRRDERFLRDLHKNTMGQHMVGYSFKCPKHNDFLLLFACNLEEGFTQQQQELIKALSKLMADGIIAGLDFKPESTAA